jgi:hypothetical protein
MSLEAEILRSCFLHSGFLVRLLWHVDGHLQPVSSPGSFSVFVYVPKALFLQGP